MLDFPEDEDDVLASLGLGSLHHLTLSVAPLKLPQNHRGFESRAGLL